MPFYPSQRKRRAIVFCYCWQMWQRLLLVFLFAIAAQFVIRAFNTENFTNWDSVVETSSPAPPIYELPPRGDMSVSASGPNPPNVAAPANMKPTLAPSPTASDPQSETAEDADAPERLRHPERSFGPGIVPEKVMIAQASGAASAEPVASAQAFQQFSPEFVQNGGSFFGSVSALEDENPNYSAF